MTYFPPSPYPQRQACTGTVDAATALDLLYVNPSSVAAHASLSSSRNRKSASSIAREKYELELQASAPAPLGEVDLIDLAPAHHCFSRPAVALNPLWSGSSVPRRPDPVGICKVDTLPAASTFGAPASPAHAVATTHSGGSNGSFARPLPHMTLVSSGESVDFTDGPWPGDSVKARYDPDGVFYHARVVRVYNSRGSVFADVEWLQPLATTPAHRHHEYLRNSRLQNASRLDNAIQRRGLVGVDVISPNAKTPTVSVVNNSGSPVINNSCVPDLPDLLDLDPSGNSLAKADAFADLLG